MQLVALQQEIHKKNEMQMTIPKLAIVNDTTIQTSLVASWDPSKWWGRRFEHVHKWPEDS